MMMNHNTGREKASILGIIGGSGFYEMEALKLIKEHKAETPWGRPSDKIMEGRLSNHTILFLPRHGRGHHLCPSEVPYHSNIAALKMLGATHILAVSAVGIMREGILPGDLVVPDQIIDQTKGTREASFYSQGAVGHTTFADPFCGYFRKLTISACQKLDARVHKHGTYICIEGPRFSSRAESQYFRRTMDPSVIGMTAMPEAALAREAGLSYALLGLATDYDCWHEQQEDVSIEAALKVLKENTARAGKIITQVCKTLGSDAPLPFYDAPQQAIVTKKEYISDQTRSRLNELFK